MRLCRAGQQIGCQPGVTVDKKLEGKRVLGVGIIGCGAISRMHIDAYLQIPGTKIVAVHSAHEDSARRVAEELGVSWYTDLEALLKRKDLDLVSICTPSGVHAEAAIAAARAGKHVVVEKPLDVTLEKIDAIIAACEENGVQLHCIFNNRFRGGNAFVKRAVDAGRFGKLFNVNAIVRWYRTPAYYQNSSWHGTRALDGGGALMNQSIHYVDLLLWMGGQVQSVSAVADTLLHRSIETEDTAAAVLRFQSGAIGTILATTSTYPGYPAELQVAGERGSASIRDGVIQNWSFIDTDPLDREAETYMEAHKDGDNRAADPMAMTCADHKRQMERAVASILTGGKPDVSGADARRSVELILAIYEASASGRPVVLGGK